MKPRTALVVPTIRPDCLARFRERWEGAEWDDVIVVFDGPREECRIEWPEAKVYCWEDYERLYGGRAWIFTRRDSACRCFGFLRAVARGAEVVITLDDDCYPTGSWPAGAFVAAHLRRLAEAPRWVSSVGGLAVRGLPTEGAELEGGGPPVTVNMGLWSGVPDLSAAETLAVLERGGEGARLLGGFVPERGTRLISPDQVFPLSGMNVAFRSRALPALYFPLMGRDSPYSRFDDIWAGLLLQRIFACSGERITIGEPWVKHERASDVQESLRKESSGSAVNAAYWRILSTLDVSGECVAECAASAAGSLSALDDPYLARWGRALECWGALCREAKAAPPDAPAPAERKATAASGHGGPKVVTITGASGFVGQLLRKGLRERGYEVRSFDRHRGLLASLLVRRYFGLWSRRWLPLAHAIRRVQRRAMRESIGIGLLRPSGDEILDLRSVLTSRFRGSHAVIHLAGLPHPVWPGAADADFRRINYEGSINVFEAARDAGTPKFVFASSAQVYRIHRPVRIDQLPILESNHCPSLEEGQSMYGWAKREVERYLERHADRGATQAVSLRLEYPGFLSRKAENFFVSTSIENLISGFACALEAPDSFGAATVNLADGEVDESVADIQAFIRECWPEVPNHSRGNECLLSTAKARSLLGYRPRPGGRYLDALLA